MKKAKGMAVATMVALAMLGGCGDAAEDAANSEGDMPVTGVALGQGGNAIDPAVMAALNDPIMVDPLLGAQADADSVRPPPRPYAGAVPPDGIATGSSVAADAKLMRTPAPIERASGAARESLTLGALAAREFGPAGAACAATIGYSAAWANRLPAALPLHPDARVIEAAGVENDRCSLRAVSFYAAQPMQAILDWYYTQARRAGYSATHRIDGEVHLLGGARGSARYALFLTDRGGGGTDVEMIASNAGR